MSQYSSTAMERNKFTISFIIFMLVTLINAEDDNPMVPFSNKDEVPSHHVSQNFNITTCNDYLPDCHKYKYTVCYEYQPWALQRCAAYCEYCKVSPLFTTPAPPCNDTLPNCGEYNSDTCTNPFYRGWAKTNCRKFCNLCDVTDHPPFVWTLPATTTRQVTTINANCHDLIPNCASYGRTVCTGTYADWAGVRCRAFCNICGTSPPPTTEPPCVDTLANCKEFQLDTCNSTLYKSWAAKNCRVYCGLCNVTTPGSTTTSTTYTTTTSTTTTTTMSTTQTPQAPYVGYGATGPSGNFLCVYKGQTYSKGATWTDGNQYKCTCVDAEINDVSCSDMCPSWNLPSFCKLVTLPGTLCPTVQCNAQG